MALAALDVLLPAVALAALTSRDFYAAACFASVCYGHDILLGWADGFAYHGSAALAGLLVVWLLRRGNPTDVAVCLAFASVATVAGNLLGFVLWFLYLPPYAYNMFFIGVYLYALWVIITKEGGKGGFLGRGAATWRRTGYRLGPGARRDLFPRDKGR